MFLVDSLKKQALASGTRIIVKFCKFKRQIIYLTTQLDPLINEI